MGGGVSSLPAEVSLAEAKALAGAKWQPAWEEKFADADAKISRDEAVRCWNEPEAKAERLQGDGQSPGVEGCPYLALLGNYRARKDNDLGVRCKQGERIGEFKPAQNVVEEWHTDGSFLQSPKAGSRDVTSL